MSNSLFENRIGGIVKLSQLDFPHSLSAILFYRGCNLRCPYCYNVGLVDPNFNIEYEKPADIIAFLNKRKGVLDGIVFSGGEATLWGSKLKDDMRYVKSLGYNTKLDTNGSSPMLVQEMIEEGILDYVAVDIKTHKDGLGAFGIKDIDRYYNSLSNTLNYLTTHKVIFETRTTIHPDITTEEDISQMFKELSERFDIKHHNLQYFFEAPETLKQVNKKPRFFDMEKVDTHGIVIDEFRNWQANKA